LDPLYFHLISKIGTGLKSVGYIEIIVTSNLLNNYVCSSYSQRKVINKISLSINFIIMGKTLIKLRI
jgi:hypothetical protein